MTNKFLNLAKLGVFLILSLVFAQKYFSGEIYNYISIRFAWLIPFAAGLFLLIGLSFIRFTPQKNTKSVHDHDDNHEHDHDHEHAHKHKFPGWAFGIISIPILLGTLVPSHPLGPIDMANQGISNDTTVASVDSRSSLTIIPSERNVLDWVRAMNANPDPAALNGQNANLIGFVYRDVRFKNDQFMVARFAVSCCVADARAMGVVVQSIDAANFTTGAWVRVEGIFQEGTLENTGQPVLVSSKISPVDQPEQPYLYP